LRITVTGRAADEGTASEESGAGGAVDAEGIVAEESGADGGTAVVESGAVWATTLETPNR
jgi:hypothetical protein